ncbi:MAG: inosine/xanthosine triphosphatase [Roseivirga sp.]|nr:inosine/xanthosine triphosphatase [Roseivirga sp.]
MKQVIIASKNPVKIQCVKQAFEKVFPQQDFHFTGISVPSGVSEQPMTDEETYAGARNRAINASKAQPEADFWAGVEGGIQKNGSEMEAFAWVVVMSSDKSGKARTASFQLPPAVVELIDQGMELGHADDVVFKRDNSKQKNGAVGILTNDLIDRVSYYEPAVILALIPFLNEGLYP